MTIFLLLFALAAVVHAQSFDSQSTGADGALELTTPGVYEFDPRAFNPPLNPFGDGVYHFTSIRLGKGVTVRLSSGLLQGSVFWLAQGPVEIDGVLDRSGEDKGAGAGGYPGGAVRQLGFGPGHDFKPNIFLVPLVGGAGGDGGENQGGGAGGGALLIASSTSITVNGTITANGGAPVGDRRHVEPVSDRPADGTGGSGGAIRLVAPVIDGSGVLSARGRQPGGDDGRIRLEAFQNDFTGTSDETPVSRGKPFGLFLPPGLPPSVRVTGLNGSPIRPAVGRNGGMLEVKMNQPSTVKIDLEAHSIPPGTVVELHLFSEDGVAKTVASTPLDGTLESSSATAVVLFPSGSSRCFVKATWTHPAVER